MSPPLSLRERKGRKGVSASTAASRWPEAAARSLPATHEAGSLNAGGSRARRRGEDEKRDGVASRSKWCQVEGMGAADRRGGCGLMQAAVGVCGRDAWEVVDCMRDCFAVRVNENWYVEKGMAICKGGRQR